MAEASRLGTAGNVWELSCKCVRSAPPVDRPVLDRLAVGGLLSGAWLGRRGISLSAADGRLDETGQLRRMICPAVSSPRKSTGVQLTTKRAILQSPT